MYTSYIGKKFLQLYNTRQQTSLSAREFFDEVLYPIFFDDKHHLLHVHNSPFFQSVAKKDLVDGVEKTEIQRRKLHKKIANEKANASIAVGFAAQDIKSTTSGQLTDMNIDISPEESYTSWIGQSLSIGVKGGLAILIGEEDVLWAIFSGWKYYRQFLQQTPNLKGKQIETWNGAWISHYFGKNYNEEYPLDNFQPPLVESKGVLSIDTTPWSKVIFTFARKYPQHKILAYIYSLGQTNTTIGFIQLMLPRVRRLFEIRNAVFINEKDSILTDSEINHIQPFYTFKNACRLGSIGLSALEPDKLRDYMPVGSKIYAKGKNFKLDENSKITFQIYRLWIIAMLNKTELKDLAMKIARCLLQLENKKDRGKTTLSNLSEEVRSTKNVRMFIDRITQVLENVPENAEMFQEVVDQVLKMPQDTFPLFITLVRFEYTYLKSLQ